MEVSVNNSDMFVLKKIIIMKKILALNIVVLLAVSQWFRKSFKRFVQRRNLLGWFGCGI